MSDFGEFLKVIAEGKKTDPSAVKAKEIKENIKSDLGSLFSEMSRIKEQDPVAVKAKEQKQHIQEVVKADLGSLFAELASLKKPKEPEIVEPIVEEIKEEIQPIVEELPVIPTPEVKAKDVMADVGKYLTDKSFQQPNPDKTDPTIKALQDKMKFLEQAIGKIAAHGPGSGEVNLRWLDDVDRPTIYDMRYLRYNDFKKKFEFAEVNPHDVVYTTHLVTTPTYTVNDEDYYVGVNYAGDVTITLPLTPSSGRMVIIKDESGNAETNPITVQGNVDNDAGGFIIQINNGAIQLIYRNGWRIV